MASALREAAYHALQGRHAGGTAILDHADRAVLRGGHGAARGITDDLRTQLPDQPAGRDLPEALRCLDAEAAVRLGDAAAVTALTPGPVTTLAVDTVVGRRLAVAAGNGRRIAGETRAALDIFTHVWDRAAGSPRRTAGLWAADLHMAQGRFRGCETLAAEAIIEAGQAIEIQREIGAHHELGKAYTALAVGQLRCGRLDAAVTALRWTVHELEAADVYPTIIVSAAHALALLGIDDDQVTAAAQRARAGLRPFGTLAELDARLRDFATDLLDGQAWHPEELYRQAIGRPDAASGFYNHNIRMDTPTGDVIVRNPATRSSSSSAASSSTPSRPAAPACPATSSTMSANCSANLASSRGTTSRAFPLAGPTTAGPPTSPAGCPPSPPACTSASCPSSATCTPGSASPPTPSPPSNSDG